jgi:SpoVK/Ycf46/Vps4 family AAA+-type ATPase
VSRGIDPSNDNYSPVSDSNLRREWTPLFSSTVSERMARKQIRRQVYMPPGRSRRATPPPAKPRPARPAQLAKPRTAQPAKRGQARQQTEPLAPDATVNFAAQRREADLDDLFTTLDRELIGLEPVKQKVAEIGALLMVDRARQRFGLTAPRPNMHMCFTGAPGTGKTTVAMMMADLLHRLGYLESGHLVQAMRDDLVGEYIGQTAPRTKRVLAHAMGGVLFIDEAYSLHRDDDSRDYGQECLDILMQVMENQRDGLVVILAG